MTETTGPSKTYANAVISLADHPLVSIGVALAPARRSGTEEESAFPYRCPKDLSGVGQRHICNADASHGPFLQSELVRCRETKDGTVVVATKEEITAARCGTLESARLELRAHPVDQVRAVTLPGKRMYRLRPPTKAGEAERKQFAALFVLAEDPKVLWLGEMRAKSTDGRAMFALGLWHGQPILTELIHPADLAETDEGLPSVDLLGEKGRAMLKQLQSFTVSDFDPALYRWDVAAAVEELVARLAGTQSDAKPVPAPKEEVTDLMAALEASVAAAKKPAKARAARKTSARKAA